MILIYVDYCQCFLVSNTILQETLEAIADCYCCARRGYKFFVQFLHKQDLVQMYGVTFKK